MKAKAKGVKITIGTDTHYADGLAMMRFGLGIARRAWLEKGDVLNCLDADGILALRAGVKRAGGRAPRKTTKRRAPGGLK